MDPEHLSLGNHCLFNTGKMSFKDGSYLNLGIVYNLSAHSDKDLEIKWYAKFCWSTVPSEKLYMSFITPLGNSLRVSRMNWITQRLRHISCYSNRTLKLTSPSCLWLNWPKLSPCLTLRLKRKSNTGLIRYVGYNCGGEWSLCFLEGGCRPSGGMGFRGSHLYLAKWAPQNFWGGGHHWGVFRWVPKHWNWGRGVSQFFPVLTGITFGSTYCTCCCRTQSRTPLKTTLLTVRPRSQDHPRSHTIGSHLLLQ